MTIRITLVMLRGSSGLILVMLRGQKVPRIPLQTSCMAGTSCSPFELSPAHKYLYKERNVKPQWNQSGGVGVSAGWIEYIGREKQMVKG